MRQRAMIQMQMTDQIASRFASHAFFGHRWADLRHNRAETKPLLSPAKAGGSRDATECQSQEQSFMRVKLATDPPSIAVSAQRCQARMFIAADSTCFQAPLGGNKHAV